MNTLLIKTPKLVHWLYPKRVWAFSRSTPNVYLTFDDGPIPEITPWVLDQLRKYNAHATFFCIGDNVYKHPEIAARIIKEGHVIANHTYHHSNGWKTSFKDYLKDIDTCDRQFQQSKVYTGLTKKLFRPPYGKMTARQARAVLEKGHNIIMWDVLSGDFDPNISEEKCLKNVLGNVKNGSIVVFHDSLKAEKSLRYILPKVLENLDKKQYKFKKIE